jgi:hypothetical protein
MGCFTVTPLPTCLRGGEGAFIDFRRFVTQRQRPKPVGDEVLDFEVIGESGFQLVRASGLACQGLLVAESSSVEFVEQDIKRFFFVPVAREAAKSSFPRPCA